MGNRCLAFDKFGNIWLAQHETDKMAVIDPQSGESKEVNIPIVGSFIQYITSDKNGNIWFSAQRGSALGQISISANKSSMVLGSTGNETTSNSQPNQTPLSKLTSKLNIRFPYVIGVLALAGIILGVLFYTVNIISLRKNLNLISKLENKK